MAKNWETEWKLPVDSRFKMLKEKEIELISKKV